MNKKALIKVILGIVLLLIFLPVILFGIVGFAFFYLHPLVNIIIMIMIVLLGVKLMIDGFKRL